MELKELLYLVYKFYPKDIDHYYDKVSYEKTKEFKSLQQTIKKNNSLDFDKISFDIAGVMKTIDTEFTFRDMTRYNSMDICYDFQLSIFLDGIYYQVILLKSFLAPIYLLRFFYSEDKTHSFPGPPLHYNPTRKIPRKLNKLLDFLKSELKNKYGLFEFSEKHYAVVLKDLSYSDKSIGDFTLFNAFFQNQDVYFTKE